MSDTIIITKPVKIKFKRTKKYKSIVQSVRLYSDECKLIEAVCKNLGITPNFFIRWCCVASAKAIKNNNIYDKLEVLAEEKINDTI